MEDKGKIGITQRLSRIRLPGLLALLGGILFLVQAILYVHTRLPNLDEGSYLYKGYLFATGVYKPFQPYGFWVNKMYLSFFIWGWIEALFAPGLLAPRYFAVILSLLSLLGLWIISCRMGNRWLAAIAIWILALNPTLISTYSTARSEVLINCMLTWVLVLSVGVDRSTWKIIASAVLAGIMTLTRENMVFVLPLLILYIFWQHGRRKGLLGLFAIIIVLLVGHIIYWPGIMSLWERWLPSGLLTFLGQAPKQNLGNPVLMSNPAQSFFARLQPLSQAIRINYIPFIGSIIVLLLWPKRESWRTASHYRAAVFLAILFFTLLISHAWASLGGNYCIYCFSDYIAFLGIVGLVLVVISICNLNKTPSIVIKATIITTLVVTTTALGYALFGQIGSKLLNIPIPRIRNMHLLPGWATLWQVLNNKYHVDYGEARGSIPAIAGFAVGILLLVITSIIYRYHPYRKTMKLTNYTVYSFIILGVFLMPILAWPYTEPICRTDVIRSYEELGSRLASIAPPGTKIYLDGSIASIPLLYTRGVDILPPQINDMNSFRTGSDSNLDLKNGFWNEQIGLQWRDEADVFVISEDRMAAWRDYLTPNKFEQIQLPDDLFQCSINANTLLFKRK